jgi:hypothetical protein
MAADVSCVVRGEIMGSTLEQDSGREGGGGHLNGRFKLERDREGEGARDI